MKTIDDVAAFHTKFGVPVLTQPQLPSVNRMRLRAKLITEEYLELMRAMGWPVIVDHTVFDTWPANPDLVAIADGCADLKYVTIGTEHEFGIPALAVWDEVQRSNMSKVGGGTREDGKIMKPSDWLAPDIASVLKKAGWVG